jgi:hypothetical protein
VSGVARLRLNVDELMPLNCREGLRREIVKREMNVLYSRGRVIWTRARNDNINHIILCYLQGLNFLPYEVIFLLTALLFDLFCHTLV